MHRTPAGKVTVLPLGTVARNAWIAGAESPDSLQTDAGTSTAVFAMAEPPTASRAIVITGRRARRCIRQSHPRAAVTGSWNRARQRRRPGGCRAFVKRAAGRSRRKDSHLLARGLPGDLAGDLLRHPGGRAVRGLLSLRFGVLGLDLLVRHRGSLLCRRPPRPIGLDDGIIARRRPGA